MARSWHFLKLKTRYKKLMAVIAGIGIFILRLTGARTLDEAENLILPHQRKNAQGEHTFSYAKSYDYAEFEAAQSAPIEEIKYQVMSLHACLYYWEGQCAKVGEMVWDPAENSFNVRDMIYTPLFTMFHGMGLCASAKEKLEENEDADISKYIEGAEKDLAVMQEWTAKCRENFFMWELLVSSELASVKGESAKAALLYDECIKQAKLASYLPCEIAGMELAAAFYRKQGSTVVSDCLLQQAAQKSLEWGAAPKAAALRSLLSDAKVYEPTEEYEAAEAIQSLSTEMQLDKSILKYMSIIADTLGTVDGAVILNKGGELLLCGQWKQGQPQLFLTTPISVSQSSLTDHVSMLVVQEVFRSEEEHVLYSDTIQERYWADSHFAQLKSIPHWVLCIPLVFNGHLFGIAYIEQHMDPSFSDQKLTFTRLLSTQLSISISNSLLYESVMQARVDAEKAHREKDLLLMKEQQARGEALILIESIPHFVWVYNEDMLEFSNDRCSKYLGVPPDQLIGWKVLDYVHPDDKQATVEKWQEAIESDQSPNVEFRLLGKDKVYRWFMVSAYPYTDFIGQRKWFGTITDIDLQKKEEIERAKHAEIAASEKKYKLLATAIPQMVFTTTHDGYLDYCNQKWTETTGLAFDQLKGHGWLRALYPEDRERVEDDIAKGAYTDKNFIEMEYRYMCGNPPQPRWHLLRAVSLRDELGTVRKWFGTCTDIEDQKRVEQQMDIARKTAERMVNVKSSFIAAMSHELRTPMNGMMGMLQLLSATSLTEEQKDYVETMGRAGKSLLSVINSILDFSRIEAGHPLYLQNENFSVEAIMEEVHEMLSPLAYNKSLEIDYVVSANVPPVLLGDQNRLRQVLVNLIGNAIKFTKSGYIFTTCHLKSQVTNNVLLEFSVEDTGRGIPEEVKSQIFAPFFQLEVAAPERHEGTGLGLQLAQQWVKAFGGEISVESEVGRGSIFTFTSHFLISQEASNKLKYQPRDTNIICVGDRKNLDTILQNTFAEFNLAFSMYPKADLVPTINKYSVFLVEMRHTDELITEVMQLMRTVPSNSVVVALVIPAQRSKLETYFEKHKTNGRESKEIAIGSAVKAKTGNPNPKIIVSLPLLKYIMKPLTKLKLENFLQTLSPEAETAKTTPLLFEKRKESKQGTKMRVLVVEDNLINQKVIQRYLQILGVDVTLTCNGEEALIELKRPIHSPPITPPITPPLTPPCTSPPPVRSQSTSSTSSPCASPTPTSPIPASPPPDSPILPYNLVLMDLSMPIMDGWEAVRLLRTWEAERAKIGRNEHIQVIALTAHITAGIEQQCTDAGFDGYISKPIDFKKLSEIIQDIL